MVSLYYIYIGNTSVNVHPDITHTNRILVLGIAQAGRVWQRRLAIRQRRKS